MDMEPILALRLLRMAVNVCFEGGFEEYYPWRTETHNRDGDDNNQSRVRSWKIHGKSRSLIYCRYLMFRSSAYSYG